MSSDPRQALERLCAERGENFASLSRLIGRNGTYIQQYLRKGSPRHLHERERRMLARFFQVPESLLGGPPEGRSSTGSDLVAIAIRSLRGRADDGGAEEGGRQFGFDRQWLRGLTATPPGRLSVIRVEGDSMSPTLNAGDDVLVDRDDARERLRDGIYVLQAQDMLLLKRLTMHPLGRRATVQSDNASYGDVPDCSLEEIEVVGRVIWAGRKFA